MLRRILFGGVATWLGRGASILLGVLLMPVLFRHLAKEELGVWLLIGQSWVALGVLDFGFSLILTRRIAQAVGGAICDSGEHLSIQTIRKISDLVATGRLVYLFLAALAFSCSFTTGLFYLSRLELHSLSVTTVWFAWGILCLSQALGIWAALWTCVLQGTGYVGWDAMFGTFVNSLTLLVQIMVVYSKGSLLSLAIVAGVGALAQRGLIFRFVRQRHAELFMRRGHWRADVFRQMLGPSLRAWLTSLGYLLVANTDQFFIVARGGTAAIPAYRAAFLLVINLHFLAGVFCGASQVFVSQLWQAGQLGQIHSILRRNARIGLLAMGCGGAAILALGPVLFEFWLGPGNFAGYQVLGTFLVTFVLEHHANVFSSCGRATNDEAYALSSIAAGVLKLALAFVLTSRLGLTGLAVSTLVAQGVTNNWFMVYRSVRRLGLNFAEHVTEVLAPCLAVFLAALGLGLWADNLVRDQRLVVRVATVSAVAALLLAGSLWRLALDGSQRIRVLRRVGFT